MKVNYETRNFLGVLWPLIIYERTYQKHFIYAPELHARGSRTLTVNYCQGAAF